MVETVALVPVAMLVILFALQCCLWARASALVQSAAAEGVHAASAYGGSTATGIGRAREFLSSSAGGLVTSPQVDASAEPGDQVELSVRGTAESVVPWIHLQVAATRREVVQRFRGSQ